MGTLTRSNHQSEGGTSKSLAKACSVPWRTLASWSPLCWCKSEETPVDDTPSHSTSALVAVEGSDPPKAAPPELAGHQGTVGKGHAPSKAAARYCSADLPQEIAPGCGTGHSHSAVVWRVLCSQPDLLPFPLFHMRHVILSICRDLQGLGVVVDLSVAEAKPGLGDGGRSPWPGSTFLAAKVRWTVHCLSPEENVTVRMTVTHGSFPDSNNSDAEDWGRQRKQKFQFSFAVCVPASDTAGIGHKQQCCFCNTKMRTFLSIRLLP